MTSSVAIDMSERQALLTHWHAGKIQPFEMQPYACMHLSRVGCKSRPCGFSVHARLHATMHMAYMHMPHHACTLVTKLTYVAACVYSVQLFVDVEWVYLHFWWAAHMPNACKCTQCTSCMTVKEHGQELMPVCHIECIVVIPCAHASARWHASCCLANCHQMPQCPSHALLWCWC